MNQKTRTLSYIGLALALIGVFLAAWLVCKHVGACAEGTAICTTEAGTDACSELGQSEKSKLFGIPIAAYGFFYYALLASIFIGLVFDRKGEKSAPLVSLLVPLAVVGVLVDITLAYTNYFVLANPCALCTLTYVVQLGLAIVIFIMYASQGDLDQMLIGAKAAWPHLIGALVVAGAVTFGMGVIGSRPDQVDDAEEISPFDIPLVSEDESVRLLGEWEGLPAASLTPVQTRQGNPGAIIAIHKWADFRCPHCLHASEYLNRLQQRWPDHVVIYYRQFPLDGVCNHAVERPGDGSRCISAKAAICAGGQPYFAQFYHEVFDLQTRNVPPEADALEAVARKVGADWSTINACAFEPATQTRLRQDIDEGLQAGVSATPTIAIDGRVLPSGTPPERALVWIVDALILRELGDSARADFEARAGAREAETE